MGMNAGGAGAERFGAPAHAGRRSPENGPFLRPGHRFPGGRMTQPGETEVPNAAVGRAALRSRPTSSDGDPDARQVRDDCGRCRSNPRPDDRHHGATARAKHRWPLLARWLEAAGIELQQEMQQGNQALAVGVQEAEVACAAKALGQHVLENQPEKIDTAERAPFRLAGLGVAIAEAHPALLAGDDILFQDDAAVEITTEDAYFDAYALSDGTLRFICLATLLLQPNPPVLILLDEPDLGLHPFAIRILAEMIAAASKRGQVLLATQSVTLLNNFAVQNVIVAENDGLKTTFNRLDLEKLKGWLDDFSLGELWEKNVLGGRP